DDGEGLAAPYLQRHVVDGMHRRRGVEDAAAPAETLHQPPRLQNGRVGGRLVHWRAPMVRSIGAYQQAASWPSPKDTVGGTSAWQRRPENGQRGAKRQPFGLSSSGGTEPLMVASRPCRRPGDGTEPNRPIV